MTNQKRSVLDLLRPEYVPVPELLLSAIAWKHLGVKRSSYAGLVERSENDKKVPGLVFELSWKPKTYRDIRLVPCIESAESAIIKLAERWKGAFDSDDNAELTAASFISALRAPRPLRSETITAIPLSAESALLQDLRGGMAKSGPPDTAAIIDKMFALGGLHPSEASGAWWGQVKRADGCSAWELALKDACKGTLLPKEVSRALLEPGITEQPASNHADHPGWITDCDTPFHWMANAWKRLQSNEWHDSLPRRRWTDWCTCVLRTGMAMGFLWEARFHQALLSNVLYPKVGASETAFNILNNTDPLLPWPQTGGTANRDVASQLKEMLKRGLIAMEALEVLINATADPSLSRDRLLSSREGLGEWVDSARNLITASPSCMNKIRGILKSGKPAGLSNLHETVKYSLQSRTGNTPHSDLYSLLRARGTRYSVIDPGSEWLVVIASLTTTPKSRTRLDNVSSALRQLGLRPSLPTITKQLEQAGMARSSPDADGALEVESAF